MVCLIKETPTMTANRNEWCFRPLFCNVMLYWAGGATNRMNVVTSHARCDGSIALLVDQQSSTLPLYYGRLLTAKRLAPKALRTQPVRIPR